eukprot:TRINITY_DN6580_c7_g1_i1.p1 TRINITY_DN6580_c7_g1~~TRINITY_DN6580_c7_g1_i1.p1  ORF type:complete len:320 (+),score=115.00 TRINITY_DN6580_c7_g1_i1:81-1040(+)
MQLSVEELRSTRFPVLRARHIPLEGMRNVRDVGGIAGLRRGLVFRGDDPINATAQDKKTLAALGLRTVIDLRTDVEESAKGAESLGASRLLCDLPPNAKQVARTVGAKVQAGYAKGAKGMAESNELLMDVGREQLAAAVRALVKPGGLPAFIHCSSGKDRTGLLVMLLLAFLGADDADIAADYALTAELLPQPPDAVERCKQQFTRYTGQAITDAEAQNVLSADPQSAVETLAMIRRVHGSAESYFRRVLRLSEAELGALRSALTAPPAAPAEPPPRPPRVAYTGLLSAGTAAAAAFALYRFSGAGGRERRREPQRAKL